MSSKPLPVVTIKIINLTEILTLEDTVQKYGRFEL